nr:MAG TPA: hypothetical protein [Caudoviricetes sp.]
MPNLYFNFMFFSLRIKVKTFSMIFHTFFRA